MLITAGIKIYLNNGLTESTIGAESGIITLTEATHSGIVTEYLSNILLQGWDSGCSSVVPLQTHPRPQTFSGGSIVLSNITGYYGKLEMYSADIKGARIERVHFLDGSEEVVSTHFISDVKVTTTSIALNLSGLQLSQNTTISTPIDGDTYYPVVFGSHEYGVYNLNPDFENAPSDTASNWKFIVVAVEKLSETTSKARLIVRPVDSSLNPANYVLQYEDTHYFKVVSGSGGGDLIKIGANNSGGTDFSVLTYDNGTYLGHEIYTDDASFWDDANVSRYSGIGETSPVIDENTTIIEVIDRSKTFLSDQFAGFTATENTYYNKDKELLPGSSYSKSGNEITENNINIVDGVVDTLPSGFFDSIELNTDIDVTTAVGASMSYVSDGMWVSVADASGYVINSTGDINNIIDSDINTGQVVEYVRASRNISPVRTALSYKVYGTLDDALSLATYVRAKIDSSDSENVQRDAELIFLAYWEDENSYYPVSEPQEMLRVSYTDTWLIEDVNFDFRNITDDISNVSDNRYHYDNYLNDADPINKVIRGNETFTFDALGDFYKTKQPTGYVVIFYLRSEYSFDAGESMTHRYEVDHLGFYRDQKNAEPETILSPVDGRPYDTFSEVINHMIKLRNWNLSGVSQPTAGWGLGEASVTVTDNASDTTPVRTQITASADMETSKQEEWLSWESWNMIYFNNDDTPAFSSILDKLGETGATHSFTVPTDCLVQDIQVFSDQDIFNTFTIEYDYDAPTGTYNKSITISNTGKSAYSTDYVTGVTDPTDAEAMWDDCKVLFDIVGAEKKLPDSRSKLKWIYNEDDAIQYINNCLKMYGIKRFTGSPLGVYFETRRIETSSHPMQDYYDVSIGDSIEYTIPNVTDALPFAGIVIGKKYSPEKKTCSLISVIRAQIQTRSIIETGSADTSIIEQGNATDNIIEVGV